jgi:hypothetical protein
MAFHIPFEHRASARQQTGPIYIGFEVPRPPRKKFNWWGFNGMWMSFASLMTLGFLSPVPLLISFMGLRRPGKKMATVGTLVSLGGIALASTIVLSGIAAHNHRVQQRHAVHYQRTVQKQIAETESLLAMASEELIEDRDKHNGELPNDIDANMIVIKHIDPWGESLRFDLEVDHGIVRSAGPDKEFDTKDDLTKTIKGKASERNTLLSLDE